MAIDLTADFTSKRDRLLWQRMEKAHSVSASIDRELVGSLAEYRCNKPFPDRKVMQRALAGGLARDR